jgi:hypothetical protein
VIARARRRLAGALDRRLGALGDRVVADAAARERALTERLDAVERRLADAEPLLRAVVDEEAANRRRLWALRASADYEQAFTESEPLVTISIPTRERPTLLLERSLPSLLTQTYERLEILVVGDDATPEVAAALRGVADPRVRFINLTTRVMGPEGRHWLAAATAPRNEAYRVARGRWTLDFDDDDALRPEAVAVLLEHARATGAEVAYGDFAQHAPDGSTTELGAFPPRLGSYSLAASLVHGGLRLFAREHVAAAIGVPGDWYRVERMLRAGVRFAHRPGVLHDYWPSSLWGSRPG